MSVYGIPGAVPSTLCVTLHLLKQQLSFGFLLCARSCSSSWDPGGKMLCHPWRPCSSPGGLKNIQIHLQGRKSFFMEEQFTSRKVLCNAVCAVKEKVCTWESEWRACVQEAKQYPVEKGREHAQSLISCKSPWVRSQDSPCSLTRIYWT